MVASARLRKNGGKNQKKKTPPPGRRKFAPPVPKLNSMPGAQPEVLVPAAPRGGGERVMGSTRSGHTHSKHLRFTPVFFQAPVGTGGLNQEVLYFFPYWREMASPFSSVWFVGVV